MREEIILAVACALLCACGGGGSETSNSTLRPAGSPDVVLLSVSGHDGALSAVLCTSDTNHAYLDDPSQAVEAVAQAFLDSGLTVNVAHFSDRLSAPDLDQDGSPDDPDQLGFVELLDTIHEVHRRWMDGFANPTRLVIVAHSHGVTWAHIATSVLSHVPVDYLISLDGICFLWECEHESSVRDWVHQGGSQPSWDISQPCDAWSVPGQAGLFNTKDIVFDNVAVNLEVQSTDLLTSDCCGNYRLDGSRDGIATFIAPESHNGVRQATSEAMLWVTDGIRVAEAP